MASSHSASEQTDAGEFQRQEDTFWEWISNDGSTAYPAAAGRHHPRCAGVLHSSGAHGNEQVADSASTGAETLDRFLTKLPVPEMAS